VIGENTVYAHGNVTLPDSKAQMYLDIEGIPDHDPYYLVGILILSEGQETFHWFWADEKSEEPGCLRRFGRTRRREGFCMMCGCES
jgi:hypothetical protein